LFEEAAKGSDVAVGQSAQMHVRMCNQRIDKSVPKLSTAEDYYAYAVTLVSRRELTTAEQQLKKALQIAPKADYALYTMALVKGLQGDISAAAHHLSHAIEIQPSNRNAAKHDPDFQELLQHAPIRELLS